jgi:hypothetical protein
MKGAIAMAQYGINSKDSSTEQAMTTTYKSTVQVSSQATGRAQIYDVLMGAYEAPNATDCAIVYDISRSTTTTTGTTLAATALNPADPAARALCRINFTTEPTITASSSVLNIALNQRASQRWVAAPTGELVIPNTSVNGLTLRAQSTNYVGRLSCEVHFTDL